MRRLISILIALVALAVLVPASGSATAGSAAPALTLRFNAWGPWGPLELGMTNQEAWQTGMVTKRASRCAAGYDMRAAYADRGFVVWRGDFPDMKVNQLVVIAREPTVYWGC